MLLFLCRVVVQLCKVFKSKEEAFHGIYMTFDDNESGKMTTGEFEDGLTDLGLLPYNFEIDGVKKRYDPRSLGLFSETNSVRQLCVRLISSRLFDNFVLLLIVINSIILGMEDYTDVGMYHGTPNWQNQLVLQSEFVFALAFLIEMVVKVIALGFVMDTNSYLRDSWNRLDFIVVLSSAATLIPELPKLSALRIFRILRPLRSLARLPGMKLLVTTLIASMPLIIDAMNILIMIFFIFAVFGVLVWNGATEKFCRSTAAPVDGVWPFADDTRVCGSGYNCSAAEFCGADSEYDLVRPVPPQSVDFGLTNFNHIGNAILVIFQVVTLEGWSNIMYHTMDSAGWFTCFFFLLLVVVGSFFMMNLLFAIIFIGFNKNYAAMFEEIAIEKEAPEGSSKSSKSFRKMKSFNSEATPQNAISVSQKKNKNSDAKTTPRAELPNKVTSAAAKSSLFAAAPPAKSKANPFAVAAKKTNRE